MHPDLSFVEYNVVLQLFQVFVYLSNKMLKVQSNANNF